MNEQAQTKIQPKSVHSKKRMPLSGSHVFSGISFSWFLCLTIVLLSAGCKTFFGRSSGGSIGALTAPPGSQDEGTTKNATSSSSDVLVEDYWSDGSAPAAPQNPSAATTPTGDLAAEADLPEESLLEEDEESEDSLAGEKPFVMSDAFCAEWNPEYLYRHKQCCAKTVRRGARRRRACAPQRRSLSRCGERTVEQLASTSALMDQLESMPLGTPQAMCGTNNGFLAHGLPLFGTDKNRILIANPARCSNYGTTAMVLLLDRLGRQVAQRLDPRPELSDIRLVVGDISAPRGGCLGTRRGAHSGHTNGLDADVAFLRARPYETTARFFHNDMDVPLNWWLFKQLVDQTPACLHYIFLDRRHISRLRQEAIKHGNATDHRYWSILSKVFKHTHGHRNHFHIRLGTIPVTDRSRVVCPRVMKAPHGSAS